MKRNPWPYAIILYFIVFIAAIATWITFAVRNDHELVRKDYYEQELKFQADIDGQARAATTQVSVDYDSATQRVTVSLPAGAAKGAIYFYRPSNAKLDRQIELAIDKGSQSVDVTRFESGLWKVRLIWTTDGVEYRHNATLVLAPTKLSSL
jgi:hypothetical protein